jgi:hypothetical protein
VSGKNRPRGEKKENKKIIGLQMNLHGVTSHVFLTKLEKHHVYQRSNFLIKKVYEIKKEPKLSLE